MKKNKIIFWTATLVVVAWEGIMPLSTLIFAPEYMTVGTKPLGYPDYFAYALTFAKILGILAITIPRVPDRLKEWAYAGLTYNLIFAFISHAYVDRIFSYMLLPLVILAFLTLSYVYRKRVYADTYQMSV